MVSKNLCVCPSVTNFEPNYLKTGETEWAEKFLRHLWQKRMSQNFLFVWQGQGWGPKKQNFDQIFHLYLIYIIFKSSY